MERVPMAALPGAGHVRVRVAFCGICGSDVHEYLHGPVTIPTSPHPASGFAAPVVLGHEVSGWVDRLGPGVASLRPGDLVALNALVPCGSCRECRRGAEHLCRLLAHIGMSADGGLATFVTVPAAMLVRVPAGMSARTAALAEPYAVAHHALRLAGHPRGRRCIVTGAGTIGLCVALLLQDGDNEVIVFDVADERLAHAERLGLRARPVGLPKSGSSAGADADVVFECSGAGAGVHLALESAAPGAIVVLLGLAGQVAIDVTDLVLREIHLIGSMSHLAEADMEPALAYLDREGPRAAAVVTAVVPLDAAVSRGLDALTGAGAAVHAKILVRVAPDA